MKRRCLRRAPAKGKRKKGRCLSWARPTSQKKSDAKKIFELGEFAKRAAKVRRKHA
jgi:hypothetical protein